MHSGDVSGGHYYAYIRPTLEPTWFKFDDDRVSRSKPEIAIDDNFGGDQTNYFTLPEGRRMISSYKKFSNACLFLY